MWDLFVSAQKIPKSPINMPGRAPNKPGPGYYPVQRHEEVKLPQGIQVSKLHEKAAHKAPVPVDSLFVFYVRLWGIIKGFPSFLIVSLLKC